MAVDGRALESDRRTPWAVEDMALRPEIKLSGDHRTPTETEAPDMALSPWPDPDTEAIDLLGQTLKRFTAAAPGSASERARVAALGKASAALVERYAPRAPQEIKDEAVVRSAGWLNQIPTGILS